MSTLTLTRRPICKSQRLVLDHESLVGENPASLLRHQDLKPAMIAWPPLIHTVQSSHLCDVPHTLGREYEIKLSVRLGGGRAYVVVCGNVQAVHWQPTRPRIGLPPIRILRPD